MHGNNLNQTTSRMLVNVKLELSKIPKEKVYVSEATGRKYLDVTIWIEEEKDATTGKLKVDQYDNNVGVSLSQTKEQREAKEPRHYIGNGKVVEFTPGGGGDNGLSRPLIADSNDDDLPF